MGRMADVPAVRRRVQAARRLHAAAAAEEPQGQSVGPSLSDVSPTSNKADDGTMHSRRTMCFIGSGLVVVVSSPAAMGRAVASSWWPAPGSMRFAVSKFPALTADRDHHGFFSGHHHRHHPRHQGNRLRTSETRLVYTERHRQRRARGTMNKRRRHTPPRDISSYRQYAVSQ